MANAFTRWLWDGIKDAPFDYVFSLLADLTSEKVEDKTEGRGAGPGARGFGGLAGKVTARATRARPTAEIRALVTGDLLELKSEPGGNRAYAGFWARQEDRLNRVEIPYDVQNPRRKYSARAESQMWQALDVLHRLEENNRAKWLEALMDLGQAAWRDVREFDARIMALIDDDFMQLLTQAGDAIRATSRFVDEVVEQRVVPKVVDLNDTLDTLGLTDRGRDPQDISPTQGVMRILRPAAPTGNTLQNRLNALRARR